MVLHFVTPEYNYGTSAAMKHAIRVSLALSFGIVVRMTAPAREWIHLTQSSSAGRFIVKVTCVGIHMDAGSSVTSITTSQLGLVIHSRGFPW